jgi:hypothetical protein
MVVLEHWVSVTGMMLTLIDNSPSVYIVPERLCQVNTIVKQKKDALEKALTGGEMDIGVYTGELRKALAREKAKVDGFRGEDRKYRMHLVNLIQSDLDAFDE